ncbi:hypothetical protein [Polymorphospora sp. NPDC050346]|uniref:hypothetical protein n=1 Tax=Polymorphospora sp. NPDC050346 TaxID=3155780 RepID=UPI0033D4BBA1
MEGQAELERDLTRAADALRDALTFLVRYDQLVALSRGEPDGTGGSVLADRVHEGLAAANRALAGLRAGRGPTACHPDADAAYPYRLDARDPGTAARPGDPGVGTPSGDPAGPGSPPPRIGHEPGE